MFLQNEIYMGIFLVFALIGIGYILYRQKPQYLPVVAMFSLFTLVFYVPNPLFPSQTIAMIYRIDRFWILIAPFMAFVMAMGVYGWVSGVEKFTKWKVFSVVICTFVCSICIISFAESNIGDNKSEGGLYFTDGELSGYNCVTEKYPTDLSCTPDYNPAKILPPPWLASQRNSSCLVQEQYIRWYKPASLG